MKADALLTRIEVREINLYYHPKKRERAANHFETSRKI